MKTLRCAQLAGIVLAFAACGGDDAGNADTASAAPVATVQADIASPATMPATEPSATAADSPESDFETAHARRLADAQAYFNGARDEAEKRHRQALENCERVLSTNEPDACVATAEESLQAELRAARVEFDARMAPPN